jgi:peptidoglycan hydrolase CwlO-like protein
MNPWWAAIVNVTTRMLTIAISGLALSLPRGVCASEYDEYLQLKDARQNLLRAEDDLKKDVRELEADISELIAKLKKKTDDLDRKRDALRRIDFAIRNCEKQLAYKSRLF